jgi:hypothetical protein
MYVLARKGVRAVLGKCAVRVNPEQGLRPDTGGSNEAEVPSPFFELT